MKKMVVITVLGLTACSIDPKDPNFLVPYETVNAQKIALAKAKEDLVDQINIYGGDTPEILCNNFIGYNGIKPDYFNCADDARRLYAIKKQRIEAEQEAERKKIADEELAERQKELAKEAAEEAKKIEEERKRQELVADIKSGRKKPENLDQAKILYDAEDGMPLASSPKIHPDEKFYGFIGAISIANEDDSFIAESIEGIANLLDYGITNSEKKYFKVIIPESLREEYRNTAQIGRWASVVGKYIENENYSTVIGQQKSMPVFEAVYWQQLH